MATREDENRFFTETLGTVRRFEDRVEASDPFWADQVSILWQVNRLTEFFPVAQMSEAEKTNAVARFSIYAGILLFLYTGKTWPVYITVLGLALSMYMHSAHQTTVAPEPKTSMQRDERLASEKAKNYRYIDRDFLKDYDGQGNMTCQEPTKDNPFGNVLITDYERPFRPPACYTGSETPKRKSLQEKYFYSDLFRDVDDIFQKNNSQRQFYTNPITTIPNDQTGFAEALYRIPSGSCKENQANCGGRANLDDLRRKSHVWIDPSRNAFGVSQVYN